jgi:hypothetical protein
LEIDHEGEVVGAHRGTETAVAYTEVLAVEQVVDGDPQREHRVGRERRLKTEPKLGIAQAAIGNKPPER